MIEDSEMEIDDELGDDLEVIPYKYSITSYGADYPVDGLVKRLKTGDIYVPSFQRGYVWSYNDASRFIESLLLGLPVPGIFLSKEQDTQKLLVIDGQQRLRTLQYFYEGIFEPTKKEFALKDVQKEFIGATYKLLKDEDRRRLDDSILHAIIVKQDEPSEDESSIYHIFERLNTGGLQLQPQEIRACIYHGEFSDLLKQLNQNKSWRSVYGKVNSRMRDQELILRFFALYFNIDNYERPMKAFLNTYMGKNKHLSLHSAEQLKQTFEPTIQIIYESIGNKAFRLEKALNAAVFDAVMIGIARRLERVKIDDSEALNEKYQALIQNDKFISATKAATSDKDNVQNRIDLATDFFANVK